VAALTLGGLALGAPRADHVGGLGVDVSSGGRRLVVTRDFDDATTQISYTLPGGRLIVD